MMQPRAGQGYRIWAYLQVGAERTSREAQHRRRERWASRA